METNFNEIKQEILRRAKKAIAMPFAILLMLFLDWEEMLETKLKVRPYDPD